MWAVLRGKVESNYLQKYYRTYEINCIIHTFPSLRMSLAGFNEAGFCRSLPLFFNQHICSWISVAMWKFAKRIIIKKHSEEIPA